MAVQTSTHNLCLEQKYEKYQSFLSENFQFLEVKLPIYLNRQVFVMRKLLLRYSLLSGTMIALSRALWTNANIPACQLSSQLSSKPPFHSVYSIYHNTGMFFYPKCDMQKHEILTVYYTLQNWSIPLIPSVTGRNIKILTQSLVFSSVLPSAFFVPLSLQAPTVPSLTLLVLSSTFLSAITGILLVSNLSDWFFNCLPFFPHSYSS